MSLKRTVPLFLAATIIAGTSAFAAPLNTKGEIKTIDAKQATITLKTGETFQMPKDFNFKSLKAGEKVTVTYDSQNGKMVASQVKPL